jgi:LacI family transcriptional regulator
MASIRDVAQRANVSTATVSHVINGTRYVSPELTKRVQSVMEELSYRPDAVARSLRRRETLTIGLLIPSVEIPFFASVAYSVERAAADNGYNIILCNSEWRPAEERIHLKDLIARRVDGLICISAGMNAEQIAPVIEADTPVVTFERPMLDTGLDAVGIDNLKGGYIATKHLLELGHRRIAAITGLTISTLSSERLQGYRSALIEAGLAVDSSLVFYGDYLPQTGRLAMEHFLSLPEKPTAVFAFNDMMALGVLRTLNDHALQVPEDMAVVGFDGIHSSQYMSPALTTVRQPISEMGRLAVELLLDRIRGKSYDQAQYIKLEPELIIRASTVGRSSTTYHSALESIAHA